MRPRKGQKKKKTRPILWTVARQVLGALPCEPWRALSGFFGRLAMGAWSLAPAERVRCTREAWALEPSFSRPPLRGDWGSATGGLCNDSPLPAE